MAPYNSTELFTAIASKASILYSLGRHESCLHNINIALQHPKCPNWIASELVEKKNSCISSLKESSTVTQVINLLFSYIYK